MNVYPSPTVQVIYEQFLTDEEIDRFTGDFRIVANFFAQKRRTKGRYEPSDPQEIVHVDAVLKLLSVMTGDDKYEQILYSEDKGGIKNMCDVAHNLISCLYEISGHI